jgi:hypothetical protein
MRLPPIPHRKVSRKNWRREDGDSLRIGVGGVVFTSLIFTSNLLR